jgi:hypothetical protein
MGDSDLGIRGGAGGTGWTPDDEDERHRAPGTGEAVSRGAAGAVPKLPLAQRIHDRLTDDCKAYDNPEHDFDACVVDWNAGGIVSFPAPTQLHLQEPNDAHVIDVKDVRQRKVGDCAFMASLAAAAGTDAGRDALLYGVQENKNDLGEVVSYSVRLYEVHWHVDGPKTFQEKWVPVSAYQPYVVGHAEAPTDGARLETWPLVMEQAFAKHCGGYNAIAKGLRVRDAMEMLTGKEVRHADADAVGATTFSDALAQQSLVVLSTKSALPADGSKLVPGHAYVVTGRFVGADGEAMLTLHNPWNHDEPEQVPESQLSRWFECVDIGSVRGSR